MGTCYHAVCLDCNVKSKGFQKMPFGEIIGDYDTDLTKFIDFHSRLKHHSITIMDEYFLGNLAEDFFLGKDDRDIKYCEEYLK
jgi:hypothetical protein